MIIEEIDKMPAGREMDAAIAEKVMGFRVMRDEQHGHILCNDPDQIEIGGHVKPYSTDIGSAWKVVEKMKPFRLWLIDLEDYWQASSLNPDDGNGLKANAETAPLAICRAALKTIERRLTDKDGSKSVTVTLGPLLETAVSYMVISGVGTHWPESIKERLEKWVINPVRNMSGSQGFLVLMGLIPLYERCLRQRLGPEGKGNFPDGHPVFDLIANDLLITTEEAVRFWRGVRNILLHWAGEEGKPPEHYRWGIKENGPAIKFEKDEFWINPFALRGQLIEKILSSINQWDKELAFLPVSFYR